MSLSLSYTDKRPPLLFLSFVSNKLVQILKDKNKKVPAFIYFESIKIICNKTKEKIIKLVQSLDQNFNGPIKTQNLSQFSLLWLVLQRTEQKTVSANFNELNQCWKEKRPKLPAALTARVKPQLHLQDAGRTTAGPLLLTVIFRTSQNQ